MTADQRIAHDAEARVIVKELAACQPISDDDYGDYCAFNCKRGDTKQNMEQLMDPYWHEPDCLWRRAKEWMGRQ